MVEKIGILVICGTSIRFFCCIKNIDGKIMGGRI